MKPRQCFCNLDAAFLLWFASCWLTRSNIFFQWSVLLLQTHKEFWVQLLKFLFLEASFQPCTGVKRHFYPFDAEFSFMADFWFGFWIQKRVVGLWQYFEVALLRNDAWLVFIFVNLKKCDLIYLLLVFTFDTSPLSFPCPDHFRILKSLHSVWSNYFSLHTCYFCNADGLKRIYG